MKLLFDVDQFRVEIIGPAVFEGHFDLDMGMLRRDSATSNRHQNTGPDVGAKERGRHMGVLQVHDGCGEGLQVGRRGRRQIYDPLVREVGCTARASEMIRFPRIRIGGL